jgi:hypothetical protein
MFEQGFTERHGEMRGMMVDACPPEDMYPLIWVFSQKCVPPLICTVHRRRHVDLSTATP